mmetsp:Transcript_13391/g.24266  ORF Transcript_13391/g.24266 Transcript_13391/m.24266 type:complete len:82 (-) Transcript_13391:1129-1374(-)
MWLSMVELELVLPAFCGDPLVDNRLIGLKLTGWIVNDIIRVEACCGKATVIGEESYQFSQWKLVVRHGSTLGGGFDLNDFL